MSERFDMNPIFEAMSAMQKSIRRNLPEQAYYFALKIEAFNPHMMWNRLQTIVVEDIGNANPNLPYVFDVLKKWYFEKMEKTKMPHLELAQVIILMASGYKSRDSVNLLKTVDFGVEFEGKEYPVPDYALDRHTLEGKKMGRNWEHFFKDACKLDQDISNPEWAKSCERLVSTYEKRGTKTKQQEQSMAAYWNNKSGSTEKKTAPRGLDEFT
jgi:replication-associated recombination protein RarA